MSAREAADRLGVDVRTLYAYVSRGALRRTSGGPGHRSSYDSDEVELLARRSRPRTVRRGTAGIDVVIGTGVSAIGDGWVRYRGHDAIALAAAGTTFEQAADLLWTADPADPTDPTAAAAWRLPRPVVTAVHRALRPLSPSVSAYHRMATGVAVTAAIHQGTRHHDLARHLIAAMVESTVDTKSDQSLPLAARIWAGRSPLRPTPARIAALDTALVLLAEHELATSTLAVRVAASTRVPLDGVLAAGLSTLGGPLHGQVADLIHQHLLTTRRPGSAPAAPATPAKLARPDGGPGTDVELVRRVAFGHPVHRSGDPRAAVMLERVRRLAGPGDRAHLERVRDLLAGDRGGAARLPNVDFALAALAFVARMPVGTAGAVFAVARAAGWVAHALEEYQERPLRYRGRALSRTGGRFE